MQQSIVSRIVSITVSIVLLLLIALNTASYAQVPTDFKTGRVMARSIVIDPATGQPIIVEFNADGSEAGAVDLGDNTSDDVSIFAAADYRFSKNQLENYLSQFEETLAVGAEVLTRVEFEQASFLAADRQTPITQQSLDEGINSVLVRGQVNRIAPDPEQLILLSFPFDLTQTDINVSDNDVSIVVDADGRVIATSTNNIGYRTGFFGDPNEAQDDGSSVVG